MNVRTLIAKIHLAYKGKQSSKAPKPSEPKYEVYLSLANDNQDRWAEDPDHDWESLYAGVLTLPIVDGQISLPEETCKVISCTYQNKQVPIVYFKQRYDVKSGAYITGPKGEKILHFVNPEDYTGSAVVETLAYPEEMKRENDTVACDNPRWLALQTAAMLARNDPAKDDEADRIFELANNEYQEMAARDMKSQISGGRKLKRAYSRMPRL